MSERVLVTLHGRHVDELSPAAIDALILVCTELAGGDMPVIHSRSVGDPSDGPTSLEFYVRSGRDV